MSYNVVKGDFSEAGYLEGRGAILVEKTSDGIRDFETRERLTCTQYGNDPIIISNGCWEFLPDSDELTRIGLVPQQTKA